MSADILRPIGQQKERVEVRLSITIPARQIVALDKLRIIKGLGKSEVVSLALELALALPPDEIAARIEALRPRKASEQDGSASADETETGRGRINAPER